MLRPISVRKPNLRRSASWAFEDEPRTGQSPTMRAVRTSPGTAFDCTHEEIGRNDQLPLHGGGHQPECDHPSCGRGTGSYPESTDPFNSHRNTGSALGAQQLKKTTKIVGLHFVSLAAEHH